MEAGNTVTHSEPMVSHLSTDAAANRWQQRVKKRTKVPAKAAKKTASY